MSRVPALIPTEEQEQRALAQWLDLHKICWCHVPNGGQRNRIVAAKLVGQGVKRGVPDILIFDPPKLGAWCGTAIELKRSKRGKISPEQEEWINKLCARNWYAVVCRGVDEAIKTLEGLGYGKR